jgi:phosphoribosyl 1,2-cyclic phosphate phosphodiesterase
MTATALRVTVLGCGGSLGVPMTGNVWGDCDPANPKNRRRRPSILVETASTTVLVDTATELRDQLNDAGATRIDAVLFTHAHADHVHGLDDLRPFVFGREAIPAYADAATIRQLNHRFAYAVDTVEMDRGLYRPIMRVREIAAGAMEIGDLAIEVFEQGHGKGTSLGFRFGPFAYSTDAARLDEAAFAALEGIRYWIVDATRREPHPSHSHLDQTLEWIDRVGPERAWLTHMNQSMDYDTLCASLPDHVRPAHDGLVIEA